LVHRKVSETREEINREAEEQSWQQAWFYDRSKQRLKLPNFDVSENANRQESVLDSNPSKAKLSKHEENMIKARAKDDKVQNEVIGPKFIMYVPSDGFGNQVLALSYALVFGWLTDRIVIVPPVLGHFEAPIRGNCHASEDWANTSAYLNQNELITAYHALLKSKMKSKYTPLTAILNLTSTRSFVEVIDSLDFFREIYSDNMSVHVASYDCCTCADTMWVAGSTKLREITIETPKGNKKITYRSVKRTLGVLKHDLLIMGSLFLPMKASQLFQPAISQNHPTIFNDAFQLPYTSAITEFGHKTKSILMKTYTWTVCAHLRVSESYFLHEKQNYLAIVNTYLDNLHLQVAKKSKSEAKHKDEDEKIAIALLVLTDVPENEFYQLIHPFQRPPYTILRIKEFFQKEIKRAKQKLPSGVEDFHFEAMGCACALSFYGHPNSTFSKRISTLRKIGCP